MKNKIFFFVCMTLMISSAQMFGQATFMSVTNGNWNNNGTWILTSGADADGIPDANDTVRIGLIQNDIVTVDASLNGTCAWLQIGSSVTATSGALVFASNTSALHIKLLTIYQSTDTLLRAVNVGAGNLTIDSIVTFEAMDTTANKKTLLQISTGVVSVKNNIIFHASNASNALLDMSAGAGQLKLGGSFILDSVGTLTTSGLGSIINFNGTTTQTIALDLSGIVYENVYVNNTSATGAVISNNITTANITGDLRIQVGKLNTSTYTITGNGTKSFTIDSGGVIVIGEGTSTNGFPSGYGTFTLDDASTVTYAGGNQTVAAIAGGYGNLTLESGANSSTKSLPAGIITILGNFTIQQGAGVSVFASANNSLTISKNVTIGNGAVLSFGNFLHTVGGNWINNGGIFSPGQSTVTFNSATTQTISGPFFKNIIFTGSGKKIASSALGISGNLTISASDTFSAGSFDHSVQGNWVNNGVLISNGKITFNGSSPQSIDSSAFYSVAFSNSGVKTATAPFVISKDFTINNDATVDGNSFSYSVGGNWINSGTFISTGTTITFNGSDSQYVSGGTLNNIVIQKLSSKTVQLTGNLILTSDFTLTRGIFDINSFSFDRNALGGSLTLTDSATFKIGGTNSFPAQFSALTMSNNSSIEYSGGEQSLTLAAYYNLILSGTGIKNATRAFTVNKNITIQNGAILNPASFVITGVATNKIITNGTLRIPGATYAASYVNFDTLELKSGSIVEYSGNNQTLDTTLFHYSVSFSGEGIKTLPKSLDISGNFSVDGVIVQGSTFDHFIGGNWNIINTGSFTSTGSVKFDGANQTISASSFNNIIFAGSGIKRTHGNLDIAGTLTINSGATFSADTATHTVQGNFVNNGSFNDSTSTFIFSGTSENLIGKATFHNLTINNAANASLTKSITVDSILTISDGKLLTNADSITLGSKGSLVESAGKVIVGKIKTTRSVQDSVNNTFGNIGFEITAMSPNGTGVTTVVRKTGTALVGSGTFSSHNSIERYFDVAPSINANLNAIIVLHYDISEIASQVESTLNVWKTTNAGGSWIKTPSDVDTDLKTITADSINKLGRFTLADSANSLTPVTIQIRKYIDTDGLISTTNNWVKKKWNLKLYADSVNGTLLSEVFNDSILSLNNLTEGTYVAMESDSANWKHLGYRRNGESPTEDTINNFVTFTAIYGETQTVDFVNFAPNSITLKKVRDNDIDFSTTDDRTPKEWKLYLYKTSVSPANLIDSIDSDTMLYRPDLGDGAYIAKEDDSTGWRKIGHILDTTAILSSTKTVSIFVAGGQNKTCTFVNSYPSKITIKNYRDTDGNIETTTDHKSKKWKLKLYKGSITDSTLVDSVNSDSSLIVQNLAEGTYIASIADSGGNWVHLGTDLDDVMRIGTHNNDTIVLTAGQDRIIKFINFNSNIVTIKSFEDTDGDLNSSTDRITKSWNLRFYKDTITLANLLYEVASDTEIFAPNLGDGTYYAVQSDSSSWSRLGSVVTGGTSATTINSDTVTLSFTNGGQTRFVNFLHYMYEKTRYRTFVQDNLTDKGIKIKVKTNPRPMPNAGNVRDTAMAKFIKNKSKLFIGVERKDSNFAFGWVQMTSGNSIRSSLPHIGTPRGLDSMGTRKLKPILKAQKAIKVAQHNNHLFGELLTLKFNIIASDVFVTNSGFGDLLYFDSTDIINNANNKTIRTIAATVDTMMTYWKKYPASPLYIGYDSIIHKINLAFADTMDTVSVSPLKIKGTKSVSSVRFLKKVSARTYEEEIIPYSPVLDPTSFVLHQNYPNPFNPTTVIPFTMFDDGYVSINLYNALGQVVMKIISNEFFVLGEQEIEFDASGLPTGVYYYRLFVNGNIRGATHKMILLK